MAKVRKTLTLDAKIVAEASALSGGNLSAYVKEALAARVRREGLEQLVADDIAMRGPIHEADVIATLVSIEAVWDD